MKPVQRYYSPHTSVVPGIMILIIVMAINLVGDGVRDVLDPRPKSGALSTPRQQLKYLKINQILV